MGGVRASGPRQQVTIQLWIAAICFGAIAVGSIVCLWRVSAGTED